MHDFSLGLPPVLRAVAVLVLSGFTVSAIAQPGTCPPAFGNGQICTAKDFQVTGVVVNGPDECTEGETIAIDLLVGLTSTANQRYDVGLFVGDGGGDVIGGASCSFASLTPQTDVDALFNGTDPAGFGPYRNLEGDACGDVAASDGENFRLFSLDSVLCRDADGDGDVDINGLVVWSQNANQDVCASPDDPAGFFPEQSSKCQFAPNYNLPITVEPAPTMEVAKRALPATLREPGGTVRFRVDVANTSSDSDPLLLTSLEDDIHGDLNGRGTCSVPQVIAPGTAYACAFLAQVSGAAPDTETDTVTATAEDDDGEVLTAAGSATVSIVAGADTPPSISVTKFAYPREIREPGGRVVYAVEVLNTSDDENVTIDTLTDDLYGDVFSLGSRCPAFRGATLAPGESFFCAFVASAPPTPPGQPGDTVIDTITATGSSANGPVGASDSATVVIIDAPSSLAVTKSALPRARPEPGGLFAFRLDVQNTSAVDTVTINALDDDIYGDLNGRGTCSVPQTLAPGARYACVFSGAFTGQAGEFQFDTILVSAVDDDGQSLSEFARARVEITAMGAPAPPALQVLKTANPTALPEPGGDVTFTVEVINASASGDITLTGLEDDPYGDLDGRGSCATGAVISADPNDVYTCSFTVNVQGAGGDELTDVVTATGVHTGGATVSADDTAVVTILPTTSEMLVTKRAAPTLLSAPGGTVEFTVSVTNTGADTLELTRLTDSVFGDLNGRGDCATGAILAAGNVYQCRFTAPVLGEAPTLHLDTVTAEAVSAGGPVLYDSARALVLIFNPLTTGAPAEIPVSPWWLLPVLGSLLLLLARRALQA